MTKDMQPKLPFADTGTPGKVTRETASWVRSTVYGELKAAQADAREAGNLDQVESLQTMLQDVTGSKIGDDVWLDLLRARANSLFDLSWWHSLVATDTTQFPSLADMIMGFTTTVDAAQRRGENHDHLFAPLRRPDSRMSDLPVPSDDE